MSYSTAAGDELACDGMCSLAMQSKHLQRLLGASSSGRRTMSDSSTGRCAPHSRAPTATAPSCCSRSRASTPSRWGLAGSRPCTVQAVLMYRLRAMAKHSLQGWPARSCTGCSLRLNDRSLTSPKYRQRRTDTSTDFIGNDGMPGGGHQRAAGLAAAQERPERRRGGPLPRC